MYQNAARPLLNTMSTDTSTDTAICTDCGYPLTDQHVCELEEWDQM